MKMKGTQCQCSNDDFVLDNVFGYVILGKDGQTTMMSPRLVTSFIGAVIGIYYGIMIGIGVWIVIIAVVGR